MWFRVAVLAILVALRAGPVPALPAFTEAYNAYRSGQKSKALAIWREEAKKGHADAQWVVGNMYAAGEGIARPDPKTAAEYYRQSAEQGHLEAQVSLATLYRLGIGVERDFEAASRWLYKAAAAGHPVAQTDLGDIFLGGENGEVARDRAQALEWYRLAAGNGVALAQLRLARMYLEGQGSEKNRKLGLFWLTVAHNQAIAAPDEEPYWSKRVMPLDRKMASDGAGRTLRRVIIDAYAARSADFTIAEREDAEGEAALWKARKP